MMMGLCILSSVVVIAPLFIIFSYTVTQGLAALNIDFFIHMPKPVGEDGGGMANAIVGTLLMVGVGAVIGLPIGIFAGIYLAEFGNNPFGTAVRFLTDVLSGIPSIVVGVVTYILIVIPMKQFSAIAGGVSLAILMIPTITRTTEEMIRLVPHSLREASLALGISNWKTTLRIILPTATTGITTGILLALARATGETAPLLFTALGNRFWSTSLTEPMASLTVFIYDYAKSPFEDWNRQAWAAAFVLIALVISVNLLFRFLTRARYETR